MTRDACVWITQNPPINNKNRQSSTIPTCPFLQPNLSLRNHLEIFHLHATSNNMVFIASCYGFLFSNVFITFVWFRFDSCMCCVSNYCSFKHVTTFVFNTTIVHFYLLFVDRNIRKLFVFLYCSLYR
uniref:(northern house mosquito) hypothetical protein n=1 Tax=Culex pipiens TaxID=7175 RepID=A0A8D8MMU2_CULPI